MTDYNVNNWLTPPYNRKAFQFVQTLFPTVCISRGNENTSTLETSLDRQNEILNISYPFIAGARTVNDFLEDTETDAFIVLKDGIVVAEKYYNGMEPYSKHLMNSVSKTFCGMVAGICIKNGVIDASKKISFYVPEFANSAFRNATVQHCLDFTAAVKYDEKYQDDDFNLLDEHFTRETAVVGWRPDLVNSSTPKTLKDFATSLKAIDGDHKDGDHFHYRTVMTNIVAMVIESATGKKFAELLQDKIWRKMGCEQDAVVVVDSSGFPYMGAGMNASARDLARFGQLLINDGYYNGQQIVPSQFIKDTRNGNDTLRSHFKKNKKFAGLMGGNGHYHNQTWCDRDSATLACIGIYGQTIYADQKARVVVVKLSTHLGPADTTKISEAFFASRAICAHLKGTSAKL